MTWASYLLVIQFDIWWEVYGLVSMESWSAGAFVLLLLIAVLLFAAGGLVLPTGLGDYPEDLDEYFQHDGRWAVAIVAAFHVTAIITNTVLFDVEIFGLMNIWNMLSTAITVLVFGAKRRVIQSSATIAFGLWFCVYLWMFVPATY